MQKIALVLIGTFAAAFSSCVPENDTVAPADIERNLQSFQYGNVDFALDLFRGLYNESENLFLSPLSVWVSLLTIYSGAKHETAKELSAVLGINDIDPKHLPASLSAFLDSCIGCKGGSNGSTVRTANRIYFQKDLHLKLCNRGMDRIFHKIDFKGDPEEARTSINDFIKNRTNGKIEEILPPQSVGPQTHMVIANAVYFKAVWEDQFNMSMTRPLLFYTDRDASVEVDMMNTIGVYVYGFSEEMDCQALEIPYSGGRISMLILLPRHTFRGLDVLARKITPERLNNLLNSMVPDEVLLTIPKFKIEQEYELTRTLEKIGLRNLFNPRFADLSGFTDIRGLSVDAIYHKSYIKVNEKGTEAAGATSSVQSRDSHRIGLRRFLANRPFLYFIRDSYSDAVLFMGTINVPRYKKQEETSQNT